jgi:hypothetical protein
VKDFSIRTLTLKKRLTTLEMHGQKFHSLAWREIGKKIWPYVTDSHEFDPEIELSNSRRDIVDSARAVDLKTWMSFFNPTQRSSPMISN